MTVEVSCAAWAMRWRRIPGFAYVAALLAVARPEGAAPVVRVRQFPTLSGRITETLIESILRDQGLDCRESASDSS